VPYAANFAGGDINNVQLQETLSGFDIEWAQFNHQPLLRGDMSIVGPRPLSVLHYERDLAQGNVTRFLIKGGLLGLGHINKGTPEMGNPKYEYEYIDKYIHLSPLGLLWFDLTIIGRGVKVILQGKGL